MICDLSEERKRNAILNPKKPSRQETLTLIGLIDSAVPQEYFVRPSADDLIQRLEDGYYIQTGERLK
jgi:hypothetical protein